MNGNIDYEICTHVLELGDSFTDIPTTGLDSLLDGSYRLLKILYVPEAQKMLLIVGRPIGL